MHRNQLNTNFWTKIKGDYESLISHLDVLPNEVSKMVMVPIGSKALMKGKIVHTNEILVFLGDGWFVKQSAKEAIEICKRRIKSEYTLYTLCMPSDINKYIFPRF